MPYTPPIEESRRFPIFGRRTRSSSHDKLENTPYDLTYLGMELNDQLSRPETTRDALTEPNGVDSYMAIEPTTSNSQSDIQRSPNGVTSPGPRESGSDVIEQPTTPNIPSGRPISPTMGPSGACNYVDNHHDRSVFDSDDILALYNRPVKLVLHLVMKASCTNADQGGRSGQVVFHSSEESSSLFRYNAQVSTGS